jgi:GNAT superfamily N-acetyltransferase
MMFTTQTETWEEFYIDAHEHFQAHFEEVGLFTDEFELDINLDAYEAGYHKGLIHIIVQRDDENSLVGYALFWVTPHQYHSDKLLAVSDVVYIVPEYRGQGRIGEMIKSAEHIFRDAEYDGIHWNIHPDRDFSSKLEGYEKQMITYGKFLGA